MMKSNFSKGFWPSLFCLLICSVSLPGIIQAQLTIKNNTTCTVFVQASQVNNGSGIPCDPCNVSTFMAIPAGVSWVHPGDATCGHYRWLGIRWFTDALTSDLGVSYSPVWNSNCGQNMRGDHCDGTTTYASWRIVSDPGPATVIIRAD